MALNRDKHRKPVIRAFVALRKETYVEASVLLVAGFVYLKVWHNYSIKQIIMFFKTTTLRRQAYELLMMHNGVSKEFGSQVCSNYDLNELSVEQTAEIYLYITFPILKSIELATQDKNSFTELSHMFFEQLFSNEGGYGIISRVKDYYVENLGRMADYENTESSQIPGLFYKNMNLVTPNSEMIEMAAFNFVFTAKEAKKILVSGL